MDITYYDLSITLISKYLHNLKHVLAVGHAHAMEQGMSDEAFLDQRLTSDMFPLKKQIQIATDNAKGIATRLTDHEPLTLADDETTVTELIARIDNVLAFLEGFTAEQFTGAGERHVVLPYFPGKYQLGKDYLLGYALPNFLFHVVTAYDIIRAQGAQVGKGDYIGSLTFHDGE